MPRRLTQARSSPTPQNAQCVAATSSAPILPRANNAANLEQRLSDTQLHSLKTEIASLKTYISKSILVVQSDIETLVEQCENRILLKYNEDSSWINMASHHTTTANTISRQSAISTRFSNLPVEIVSEILCWIRPKNVWKLRVLSSTIHECIISPAFARKNLARYVRPTDATIVESCDANDWNISHLKAPEPYLSVYIREYLRRLTFIAWGWSETKKVDDATNIKMNMPLPIAFCHLKNLRELALVGCYLRGPIPPEIEHLTLLTSLNLSHNKLTGNIPPSIVKLENLTGITLINNLLSGPLPDELFQMWNLDHLNLCENRQLSGPLPVKLSKLTKLKCLALARTAMSGPIPTEWSTLSQLEFLTLYEMPNLRCKIPVELGQLSHLKELDISYANLYGPIPSQLSRLSRLESLELIHNELEGRVPGEMAALTKLVKFDLRGNPKLTCDFECSVLEIDAWEDEKDWDSKMSDDGSIFSVE